MVRTLFAQAMTRRMHRGALFALTTIVALTARGAFAEQSDFANIRDLKSLGVKVFYPREVPARFTLSSVEKTQGRSGPFMPRELRLTRLAPLRRNYVLKYCDPHYRCIRIASVSWLEEEGCVGRNGRVLAGRSPYFGDLQVCAGGIAPNSRHAWVKSEPAMSAWLHSNFARPPEKRSLTGPPNSLRFYVFDGDGLTDREAIAIVESLTPLP